MIQQSVGGLAVSVVIREPGFSPVALPSFRGPGYCLDPLHLAGRGGSGHGGPHQGCSRQDTHFLHILVSQSSATWPPMATGTLGHVVFLGESREENASWRALGFLIILDNCQGGLDTIRVGKKSTEWMDTVFEREHNVSICLLFLKLLCGFIILTYGLPRWLSGKESACNAGDGGLIPGLGRSPGKGNGNPLQYSCLGNPMVRGAWQVTGHKNQTWLSD